MNQILSTSAPGGKGKKHTSSEPADVKKVIRVFSIILLIFAIFIIGTSSYAMYQSSQAKANIKPNPTITVETLEDDTIVSLKVVSEFNIDTITYGWNDGQKTTIRGNGRKYVEEKINIPTGSNLLNIYVTDVNGGENTFSNTYDLESKIKLEALDTGNIKITYQGETQISYMTYRWDDEDEETIDINNTSIEKEIEARKGTHTLTIVVVDVNNKTETKVQEIKGVSKPTIKIGLNNDKTKYIISLSDEIGLKEVIIVLNEDENNKFGQKLTEKEFQLEIPLQTGSDNKLKVIVTNSDGIQETERVQYSK